VIRPAATRVAEEVPVPEEVGAGPPGSPAAADALDRRGVPPAGARLRRAWLRPVAIFLAARGGLALVAWAVAYLGHVPLATELSRWDSGWYLAIAAHGYGPAVAQGAGAPHVAQIAFFPLLPLVVRGLEAATGMGLVAAGLVASSAAALGGAVVVWHLAERRYGQAAADRATALVFCFPGAFVLAFAYSESLLIPLVAGCLLALGSRHWLAAGLLAGLATAVDPTAVAVVVPCALAAAAALRARRDWRALWAALLSPLGIAGYFAYLWHHDGTPLAWFDVERRVWHQHPTLVATWDQFVAFARHPFVYPNSTAQVFGFLVAMTLLAVAVATRADPTWIAYAAAVFLLALLSPQEGFMPRIVLHAFPLVVVAGAALRRWFVPVLVASSLLMAVAAILSLGSLSLTP
jgi:hypothetical protein